MPIDPSFWHGLLGAAGNVGAGQGGVARGYLSGLGAYEQSQLNAARMRSLEGEAALRRQKERERQQQRAALEQYATSLEQAANPLGAQAALMLRALGPNAANQNPQLFERAMFGERQRQLSQAELAELARIQAQTETEKARRQKLLAEAANIGRTGGGLDGAVGTKSQQYKQWQQDQRYQDSLRMITDMRALMLDPETRRAGYESWRSLETLRRKGEGWGDFVDRLAGDTTNLGSSLRELAIPGVTEYMAKTGQLYNNLKGLVTDETRLTDKDREYLNRQLQLVFDSTTPDTVLEALDVFQQQLDIALAYKAGGGQDGTGSVGPDARGAAPSGGAPAPSVAPGKSLSEAALDREMDSLYPTR